MPSFFPHKNIATFPRGLVTTKMCTPVTEQEHLPWALLQKMTFSICVHTWIWNYFQVWKALIKPEPLGQSQNHFILPTTRYSCSSETTLSCALVWVKVSQDTEKEWRIWWILIFRMVQGCSRAEPQSRSSSWLPPLSSQGKPPVSQSVKKDPKTIPDLL